MGDSNSTIDYSLPEIIFNDGEGNTENNRVSVLGESDSTIPYGEDNQPQSKDQAESNTDIIKINDAESTIFYDLNEYVEDNPGNNAESEKSGCFPSKTRRGVVYQRKKEH